MAVALAVVGGVMLAAGFGLVWLPLGVIAAGIETLSAAYAVAYLRARRAS